MSKWRFSESLGEERIRSLLDPPDFDAISHCLKDEMKVLCFHRQTCDDDNHFSRVVFCVQVNPLLFDLFFNCPEGYRGAYYRSPYAGLEANDTVIRCASSKLLEWAGSNSAGFGQDFANQSLSSSSAKVWLAECGMELCERCKGEWSRPTDDTAELENDRWEKTDSGNARFGRKAPRHSKLRIFGAFLNDRFDEFVPTRKRHRALDIHNCGWS